MGGDHCDNERYARLRPNGRAQESKADEGSVDAAIIGAGPYGLSAAAHLRAAGVETRLFGKTMVFWRSHMPAGMLLRSAWEATHIADPGGRLTLDAYAAERGAAVATPIPLADFVDYGEWFRERAALEVDARLVRTVGKNGGGFHLELEDGAVLGARSVIVATGVEHFAWRPPEFAGLPPDRLSHSSEHAGFAKFESRRVTVLGGGQSAAESAALLHEAGADVELVLRKSQLRWLAPGRLATQRRLRRVLYPPSDVGPPGLNWVVAMPDLFRTLPRGLQPAVSNRVLRPAVSDWLRPRLDNVLLRIGRTIIDARSDGEALTLTLDDGSWREIDHLLLATGFRIDVSRLPFLGELAGSLPLVDGAPRLGRGFESAVAGLHFVGAAATESFGPIMRFVAGTGYAARAVTARLCNGPRRRPAR
ncbi:MAG: NAD(P)-binding domain-containing protein [Actinomycetota bacterium]|nr:NAD(P)-binding domain-containing protein [Actinomycetota bacterium]